MSLVSGSWWGWVQRWRMRLQCLASGRSQTSVLGLPYRSSVPQRPRPWVVPTRIQPEALLDAAGEGGTSTKVSTRTGVRATVATACSRAMWTWWGGDSTPVGGTDGVRPGGRGDRRRSGGNADQAARRSPRGPSRSRRPRPAVIGGRGRTSACAAAWGTRGPCGSGWNLNRERCRSGGFPGGQRGAERSPLPVRHVQRGVGWLTTQRA